MKNTLPRVFIGSSVEGLPYAEAIFSELEYGAYPTIWKHDIFQPTKAILEVLEDLPLSFDYAVLVMTPDDIKKSRGKKTPIPRDNVVAELGLFIGALGRSRVFFIQPRDKPISLPSDFLGIVPLEYTSRDDNNLRAAVQTACTIIKSKLKKPSARRASPDGSATDVKFWHAVNDREVHNLDVRALINGARRYVILTGVSLHYVIRHCDRELRDAVSRKVSIGFVISEKSGNLTKHYARYSSSVSNSLPAAQTMYIHFHQSLSAKDSNFFSLHYTSLPLTHSIGLYDGRAFVNGFWIDRSTSVCPSFSPEKGSPTYLIILSELSTLIKESRCIRGLTGKKLLQYIKKSR